MSNPFGDREVITREPAYLTKAFGKKLAKPRAVSGVNECLLSDGTTVFECVGNDFVSEDIERVIRHRSKHTRSTRHYAPGVIDKLMKYRELERAKSVRGWSERVAARLNKDKAPRPDGSKWLAVHVASLAQSHLADYEAREQEALKEAAIGEAITQPPGPAPAMTNRERAITIATNLNHARKLLDEIASMEAIFNGCDHDDYDELKAKAAMLDQMRAFMGEGK